MTARTTDTKLFHKLVNAERKNYKDIDELHVDDNPIPSNIKFRKNRLLEQKLLTFPEHLSSPRFLVGFVLLDLLLYVYVL